MEKFTIRKIKTEDYEYIKGLWDLHFGSVIAEKRARSFNLILDKNPYCKEKNGYFVGEENGLIIAYCGMMPSKFHLTGEDYSGCIYQDSMVNPTHRGKGIATKLCKEMVKQIPFFSIAVWMNAPNSHVFEKSGWKPVDGLDTYVRGYHADFFIKTKSRIVNRLLTTVVNFIISSMYRVEKLFYRYAEKDFSIVAINEFDEGVDSLFHSVKQKFGYITYRTKDILNWKYSNEYSSGYTRLICKAENEILGYIIFKTRVVDGGKKLSTIFDYLCSPERGDVFKALLKHAILKIEKDNPDSIEIICSNKLLKPILKRFGFLRSGGNKFALKYIHEEKVSEIHGIDKGDNWHFTHGDGDKLFWEI